MTAVVPHRTTLWHKCLTLTEWASVLGQAASWRHSTEKHDAREGWQTRLAVGKLLDWLALKGSWNLIRRGPMDGVFGEAPNRPTGYVMEFVQTMWFNIHLKLQSLFL